MITGNLDGAPHDGVARSAPLTDGT